MPRHLQKRNEWIGAVAKQTTIESELEKKKIIKK